jgi:hypothetical protein
MSSATVSEGTMRPKTAIFVALALVCSALTVSARSRDEVPRTGAHASAGSRFRLPEDLPRDCATVNLLREGAAQLNLVATEA